MYYAHSLEGNHDRSNWHALHDHLTATGNLAATFAGEFGAENAGRIAGNLHDLGKYSAKFQARLMGGERVDHSTAGAKEILALAKSPSDKAVAALIAYAIAGHHSGLADFDKFQDRINANIEPVDPIWRDEIKMDAGWPWGRLWPNLPRLSDKQDKRAFQLAFLGRMIFSCLVDADYKDTEAFYVKAGQKTVNRGWPDLRQQIERLIAKFDAHMLGVEKTVTKSDLNATRYDILRSVRARASELAGLFTLTIPTGGGKTLASLGFALDHARAHNLRRIIYAIPFTSIIDQTAGIFRNILGEDYVLEHHSSIEEDKNAGREQKDKLKLAMEDWAAPVVVTTNVQLFESLFANRPSKCRKLHNLARSVIILDEAQTLPLGLLRPCLAALDELANHYGCTVVLCTATQPAVDVRDFKFGGLELEGRELAPDPAGLARKLKRVQISTGHELDDDQLVDFMRIHDQALVIVNSRKHALSLYQKANQAELSGIVHLTTRQYAAHRRQILMRVRDDLKVAQPCRLVATSLIEAGVDVDFPRVWRAEAGLDSVAQAAGRCNREGKRAVADSIVTVFKAKDNPPPADVKQLAADFGRVAAAFPGDLLSPDAMKAYFKEVIWRRGAEQVDEKKILARFTLSGAKVVFNYETVAQEFRMIENGLSPVIINDSEAVQDVLDMLNSPNASAARAARALQPFIVQVPPKDRNALLANQRVAYHREDLWGQQFAVLTDASLYKPEIGLIWENADVLEETIF